MSKIISQLQPLCRSSMFDSSSLLSSRQLAAALIDHLKRSSLDCGQDADSNIIENDDFHVEAQAVDVEKTAF